MCLCMYVCVHVRNMQRQRNVSKLLISSDCVRNCPTATVCSMLKQKKTETVQTNGQRKCFQVPHDFGLMTHNVHAVKRRLSANQHRIAVHEMPQNTVALDQFNHVGVSESQIVQGSIRFLDKICTRMPKGSVPHRKRQPVNVVVRHFLVNGHGHCDRTWYSNPTQWNPWVARYDRSSRMVRAFPNQVVPDTTFFPTQTTSK